MDEVGTGVDETGSADLAPSKEIELGLGDRLGQVLLGDGALGDALESLDRLLGGLSDGRGGAVDLDGQQAGIRVGVVGGGYVGTRSAGGGLGQEAEARSPLDVGLAAEESDEHVDLGRAGGERSTREAENQRVGALLGDTLLTTVVLGGGRGQLGRRRLGNGLEERFDPLGQPDLVGTVGDDGDVGLGVGSLGEGRNGVLVQVARDGSGGGRVEGGAETVVEGNGVGGIQSEGRGVDLGLLEMNDPLDILVELEGYPCLVSTSPEG